MKWNEMKWGSTAELNNNRKRNKNILDWVLEGWEWRRKQRENDRETKGCLTCILYFLFSTPLTSKIRENNLSKTVTRRQSNDDLVTQYAVSDKFDKTRMCFARSSHHVTLKLIHGEHWPVTRPKGSHIEKVTCFTYRHLGTDDLLMTSHHA